MDAEHVLEVAKDRGGARVIEAFLSSDASGKLKRRLVMKYVWKLHSKLALDYNVLNYLFLICYCGELVGKNNNKWALL